MEEEKTTESETDEKTTENTTPMIDNAREAAILLKAENNRSEELLNRREKLDAKRELGGESEAGNPKVEKKEETPKEYNDRIYKELSEGKHDE